MIWGLYVSYLHYFLYWGSIITKYTDRTENRCNFTGILTKVLELDWKVQNVRLTEKNRKCYICCTLIFLFDPGWIKKKWYGQVHERQNYEFGSRCEFNGQQILTKLVLKIIFACFTKKKRRIKKYRKKDRKSEIKKEKTLVNAWSYQIVIFLIASCSIPNDESACTLYFLLLFILQK